MTGVDLSQYGIHVKNVHRNIAVATLYQEALRTEKDSVIASSGALIAYSYGKTGRSPKDKHVVQHPDSKDEVWWGPVNVPIPEATFGVNRERATDYLNTREVLYVVDGFAGWDPKYRLKVRVVCTRPYHALFMHTMLIRPTQGELAAFGEPDVVIFNAGQFPANRHTTGMTSKTSVDVNLESRELVILGTEYAGEMKKGVLTLMNYFMPKRDVLSMHCSATSDMKTGASSILFGLSGTGKTTLSADPKRYLIGDDEHCWSEEGIFNIEGGCYAKAINLAPELEPDIFQALRFGAVLENVVYDRNTHEVDFADHSLTENTRGAYPIEFIQNAKLPCVAKHPKDVVFLTCDAFGVLPPVSRLTPEQAMYHFISGYTAKVAGTEMGVTEPEATFSPCFGGPFLIRHPGKYADLLRQRIETHKSKVWLVNTGWSGGAYGTGKRMNLAYTRSIVDAIHSGALAGAPVVEDALFGCAVVTRCPNVPDNILIPRQTWARPGDYDATAKKRATLFTETSAPTKPESAPKCRPPDPASERPGPDRRGTERYG